MCTCIGITSMRSITSRIDFHCDGLARTSSELVSSTADTPTSAPSTLRVTLPLPLRLAGRVPPSPRPVLTAALEVPDLSSMPPSLISVVPTPGIIEGDSLPLLPLPPPNTSARRSARSRALMYFSS